MAPSLLRHTDVNLLDDSHAIIKVVDSAVSIVTVYLKSMFTVLARWRMKEPLRPEESRLPCVSSNRPTVLR